MRGKVVTVLFCKLLPGQERGNMGQRNLYRGLDRASALNYYCEDVNVFKDFVYI